MSRNGSGTYSLPAGNPVATGSTISSTWANTTLSDIATALTQSISADGQTPITANIPMNGKKLTGLGAATSSGDALSYGQTGAALTSPTLTTPTVNGATVSGTIAGTATWSGAQTFSAGASVTDLTVTSTGGNIYSGTYTPTTTAVQNVTAVSPVSTFIYTRVGSFVHVSGVLSILPTAAGGAATAVRMTLPVASNFTLSADCIGVANQGRSGESYVMTGVVADTVNKAAQLSFDANNSGNSRSFYVSFHYQIK